MSTQVRFIRFREVKSVLDKVAKVALDPTQNFSAWTGDEDTRKFTMQYSLIYNACTQKNPHNHSKRIYDVVTDLIRELARVMLKESLPIESGEHRLRSFATNLSQARSAINWLSKISLYLDRYYAPQNFLPKIRTLGEDFLNDFMAEHSSDLVSVLLVRTAVVLKLIARFQPTTDENEELIERVYLSSEQSHESDRETAFSHSCKKKSSTAYPRLLKPFCLIEILSFCGVRTAAALVATHRDVAFGVTGVLYDKTVNGMSRDPSVPADLEPLIKLRLNKERSLHQIRRVMFQNKNAVFTISEKDHYEEDMYYPG
mmetsp:Transcript_29254/g.39751  ORF Transcript_29254/g.39751 Transcript_29254/m.39751 type:complete len:314 (-) Transcript_29254:745-1686(-)